jgi:hypothetical protein
MMTGLYAHQTLSFMFLSYLTESGPPPSSLSGLGTVTLA